MLKAIKISIIMAILALVAFSQPCMARDLNEIYSECGLGALLFPKSPGLAASSNCFWDWGTTATSSDITSPDTCAGGKEKVARFIYESYESLEKDLASGSGTHLEGLMALLGPEVQSKENFVKSLRHDFAKVVAESSYTAKSRFEKVEALYSLIYKHVEDAA